jgi:hypothetical protein
MTSAVGRPDPSGETPASARGGMVGGYNPVIPAVPEIVESDFVTFWYDLTRLAPDRQASHLARRCLRASM